MAELPKMLERRDTGEPMHVRTCIYIFAVIQSRAISSRGDYSRAASISLRACSGAATIRERRLFGHIWYTQKPKERSRESARAKVRGKG